METLVCRACLAYLTHSEKTFKIFLMFTKESLIFLQ